ncbi:MAG TPA: cytochrome c biogenesis protein CcsA, partial [Brevibacterium sp.]|nr:cytochrome c biogenesis protein CcsA [Brevibacterium sp.]
MLTLAQIGLKLAFGSSLVAIAAFIWGHSQGPRNGAGSTKVGYYASYAAAAFFTLCVAIMTLSFFRMDFQFDYVALNMPYDVSSIAWLYKLSGVWAGREGSLLFWTWLISLFNAWMAYRRQKVADPLSNMGIMVTNVVMALFGAAMIFSTFNDPFKQTPAMFLDAAGNLVGQAAAWGMNPLLQHWAMTAHPPTLFVGYAGMTIPFAFAVAAMIVKDGSKLWVEIVNRVTVFAWVFLGIGIGLGAVWAYVVLGWGGYWAWDPVENASLLPWLTGVGLLHSFTLYRRRGAFKTWAIINACVSFSMVILGTFITRSGVIQSVHAFASDPVSLYLFLTMIIAPIVILVYGLSVNKKTFESDDAFESLTSREAAYYFNNVIMLVASVLIAYLTLSQSFPSWMPFGGMIVAPESYDAVARPIGIAYIMIIALCPLLSWGRAIGKEFWKKMLWPGIAALGIFALLMVEWWVNLYPNYVETLSHGGSNAAKLASAGPSVYYNGLAILGLSVAAITITTTLFMFVQGVRARMKGKGESAGKALSFILFRARTQSGGYLAHLGMAIILIGLVGSNM